jgi:enoyl-CoA hydratase
MNEYENLLVEHRGPLTWVVLNRPDKANALSQELLEELSAVLEELVEEGGPVIAVRGAGRGFSAGYDLGKLGKGAELDPVADRARLQGYVDRFLGIWDHPKPIIAAVHGFCIAGATQLCTFTDITIVADDAKIGEPKLPIGGGFIAPLWAPLVGPKRSKELSFVVGNSIDGPTAVEWGWANHCVPADELIGAVESLAERIALTPPDVLRVKKLSINRAMEAMGIRHATTSVAEMDTLLHLAPEVVKLRKWVGEVGLDKALEAYRVAPSTPLRPAPDSGQPDEES